MRDFVQQRSVFQHEVDTASAAPTNATSKKKNEQEISTTLGERNLYEEMKAMCELSALVYTVAYLVDLIGKGGYPAVDESSSSPPLPSSSSSWWPSSWWKPKPPLKQLQKTDLILSEYCSDNDTPSKSCHTKLKRNLPASTILEFIDANQEALSSDSEITGNVPTSRKDELVHPRTRLVLSAMQSIQQNNPQDSSLWCFDHHFGDTSLVYAITVNKTLKRVTIVFRGSSTKNDWYQNIQIASATLPTPLVLLEDPDYPSDEKNEIRVHGGFREYLLDDDLISNNRTMTLDEMKSMNKERPGKYGQILEDLEEIYTYQDPKTGEFAHEGFHLYVSGHSLGGALSTLLAMKLACSWTVKNKIRQIPEPIINISVASPYVGNQSFADAVKFLERKNWLRHVRVTNQGDVVPVAPPKRFLYGAVYEPYIHTGVNVHLVPNDNYATGGGKKHEIGFGLERTFASQFTFSSAERHNASDYWIRQEADRAFFEGLSIDQLYSKIE